MYSRLRLYFSSRMGSVCVSLPFCVPYLRFHFRSRRRSFWVWVTLCRLSAFTYTFHLRSVSVFPFCVLLFRSFSLFVAQCSLSIRSDSCYRCSRSFSGCVFFLPFNGPFQAAFNFPLFAQFDTISVALKLHLQKKNDVWRYNNFKMLSKSLESWAQIN